MCVLFIEHLLPSPAMHMVSPSACTPSLCPFAERGGQQADSAYEPWASNPWTTAASALAPRTPCNAPNQTLPVFVDCFWGRDISETSGRSGRVHTNIRQFMCAQTPSWFTLSSTHTRLHCRHAEITHQRHNTHTLPTGSSRPYKMFTASAMILCIGSRHIMTWWPFLPLALGTLWHDDHFCHWLSAHYDMMTFSATGSWPIMTWRPFLPLACWWPLWWLEHSCPASARTPVTECKTSLAGRKERTPQKAFKFWWHGQQGFAHHNCSFCARFSVLLLLVLLRNCSVLDSQCSYS